MEDHDAQDVDERAAEWKMSPTSAMPSGGAEASPTSVLGLAGYVPTDTAYSSPKVDRGMAPQQPMRPRTGLSPRRARIYPYTGELSMTSSAESTLSRARRDEDTATGYRTHYRARYESIGRPYEHYHPAYRFGETYASDERYRDREWQDVEMDARRDWSSRGEGAWEDVKDAVREGWERVRGRR
jgi:hypothetical protein